MWIPGEEPSRRSGCVPGGFEEQQGCQWSGSRGGDGDPGR